MCWEKVGFRALRVLLLSPSARLEILVCVPLCMRSSSTVINSTDSDHFSRLPMLPQSSVRHKPMFDSVCDPLESHSAQQLKLFSRDCQHSEHRTWAISSDFVPCLGSISNHCSQNSHPHIRLAAKWEEKFMSKDVTCTQSIVFDCVPCLLTPKTCPQRKPHPHNRLIVSRKKLATKKYVVFTKIIPAFSLHFSW